MDKEKTTPPEEEEKKPNEIDEEVPCQDCNGSGFDQWEDGFCPSCEGRGTLSNDEAFRQFDDLC